jgi:putative DNA methylase
MNDQDKRLIEDYLPIVAISAEASREKSVRKGHISTLHLWWARRPLVACRAAVYGALVPANRFVPNEATNEKKKSLGRANAAKFITSLCKYPGDQKMIAEAQRHILEAHAERLTKETGEPVTVADIEDGRAPRPKVLDMFAGGGAIPLEALRLGCQAYSLDLNPVAHIIQLCTLVYPQKYGQPDPAARGMTGPTNAKNETSWGGLAKEVRYWGEWVLKKVKAEIGDLYPLIPDPAYKKKREPVKDIFGIEEEIPPGYLLPVAYLWTRTVICKNPSCKATVPLGKQTWLSKKKDRHVALKSIFSAKDNRVQFEIREATSASGMSFDPDQGSEGGSIACPFCKAVADAEYVQAQGIEKLTGAQLLAAVCTRPGARGKTYLAEKDLPNMALPDANAIHKRIESVCRETGLSVPNEPISSVRPSPNARGLSGVTRHGFMTFGELFSARQLLVVLTFAKWIRAIGNECERSDRVTAIATYCGLTLDKVLSRYSTFSPWDVGYEKIVLAFGKHMLPMVWDYAESIPLQDGSGGWPGSLDDVINTIEAARAILIPGNCSRGSATQLSSNPEQFDAIITDPPYYDNIPYADISDFFYVWMKRSLGTYHAEHFASQLTPKKSEATALSSRHAGDNGQSENRI